MFKNLTIKMKLISSFLVMIVLIAGLAIYSISSISETSDGFNKYKESAKNTDIGSNIQINMLVVRMYALNYFKDPTQENIDGYHKFIDISMGFVKTALSELKHSTQLSMAKEINESYEIYNKGFLEVIDIMKEKSDIYASNLAVNGKKINDLLLSMLESAKNDKNIDDTYLIAKSVNSLLLARVYNMKYFSSDLNSDYERVLSEFTNLNKALNELVVIIQDPKRKEQLKELISLTEIYKNGSARINKVINDRDAIIVNLWILDRKIGKLSEDIKLSIKDEQNIIDTNVTNLNSNIKLFVTIISLVILVLSIILAIVLPRNIANLLNTFQTGLMDFFKYLNRESKEAKLIEMNSTDEFGIMAKVVNDNIEKTKKGIDEDRKLIDETVSVLGEFEQGDLVQRLNINVSNPALMQLKDVLNRMADNLENNINNVLNIVEEYSSYNYLNKISTNGLKEHLLKLASGVNNLGDSITEMLVENKSNGLTLDKSSNTLLSNVDKLNQSSNEAASSLEETAAALEEITSNIRNNTENIAKMSKLSDGVTTSANEGEKLANDTTVAMEEINTQVTAIKEAITVIDQIAFQTNILSLNAAVEAATAGEAGKGFAVVAAEVRSLASRSAEAAKGIKELVENATNKANDGKNIAGEMIKGYKVLNGNILETTNLISDISSASKEQLLGIEQINDAVNQLDQQTQQNAKVASETQDIAILTDQIAKLIVSDADNKEFNGKNSVKAKVANTKQEVSKIVSKIAKKETKIEIIKTKRDNGDWESF
ncbi:MCP-domain signal transduction protein [Arcobacter venerupis]|uniref:MCP-domain signal transduction protein n=1 Tax=Arcobacter venerupis TaxID=1054033 RepID=A0AAE7BA61_9BACT|nr:methyl-accepting chemotaxis protein [Arcobacter venerupis]QKF66589.1 MCP-domain signal transduction protein [Arcobacter venerupis]RWS49674.1 chemotaxis protein [Arcobacter venerupis]